MLFIVCMRGFFLDTVHKENSIIFIENDQILGKTAWESQNQQAEMLLPNMEKLLTEQQKTWKDIDFIGCITGPGRFTSTRIGIMITNSVAHLLHISIFGINLCDFSKDQIINPVFPFTLYYQSEKGDFFIQKYEENKTAMHEIYIESEVNTSLDRTDPYVIFYSDSTVKSNCNAVLRSFDETVCYILQQNYGLQKDILLDPVYIREANITQKKKL